MRPRRRRPVASSERRYLPAYVKNIADDDNDNIVGMFRSAASSALFTNLFTPEPRTYGRVVDYYFL